MGPVRRTAIAAAATMALATVGIACGADADESAAERGAGLYRANCAACHGDDLRGNDRGPSLLEEVYLEERLTDAQMADAIRDGVEENRFEFGPMPGNGALRELQVREIVAYVRAQQAAAVTP